MSSSFLMLVKFSSENSGEPGPALSDLQFLGYTPNDPPKSYKRLHKGSKKIAVTNKVKQLAILDDAIEDNTVQDDEDSLSDIDDKYL